MEYIQGENGSFATQVFINLWVNKQDLPNDYVWIVKGEHGVFREQENGEFGYHCDLDFDEMLKLPKDTPIHASTLVFDGQSSPLTAEYETVGDLLEYAKETLDELRQNQVIAKVMPTISQKMIYSIARKIFDGADWSFLSTEADWVSEDAVNCFKQGEYDAYPELFLSKEGV